jgi:hypothetical protein
MALVVRTSCSLRYPDGRILHRVQWLAVGMRRSRRVLDQGVASAGYSIFAS